MVVLDCRLALGGAEVERISGGLAVGVVSASGPAAPRSDVGEGGWDSADGGVALDREGLPGARDFEGAQAAIRTDAESIIPARRIVRLVFFVRVDVMSHRGTPASPNTPRYAASPRVGPPSQGGTTPQPGRDLHA
jgi:hypothetical protein